MTQEKLDTNQKALRINLDATRYGTFAEIGAGQEVARWFFHVGGASGTVAKTISAYDMAVSDAIYGPAQRYVSRQRLCAMLDCEYDLLLQRLGESRGEKTSFFVYADTVATRSFTRHEEGHGWLGIRFQTGPRGPCSEILIHVRMFDTENERQQQALGVMGVNLIYGAVYSHEAPEELIASLLDNLTRDRIEVDMIGFTGPAFSSVDNRLMALQLVKQGLTEAAMFTAQGETVQWNEVLHNKPVFVQRGSFHPITNATLDVFERALDQFVQEPELKGEQPVVFMEMTLRQLATGDAINEKDFLARSDMLSVLGKTTLISNFWRFHRLAAYLSHYTDRAIGIALGASKLKEIFDESLYADTEGGMLGGLGELFKNPGRLYVYPSLDFDQGKIVTAEAFEVASNLKHLYAHLLENHFIKGVRSSNEDFLRIRSQDVLDKIAIRDSAWEKLVPPQIVEIIKREQLFGYRNP